MRRPEATITPESRRWRQVGFTVIELIVALMISGLALAGASALLSQLADGAERIDAAAQAADRDANGERLLRALFHRLEVGTSDDARFEGDERVARFATWCEVPAGWLERCQVALEINSTEGQPALVAILSRGEVVSVRMGFVRGALRYIGEPSGGGTWYRVWGTGLTAPSAVGVILDADTLILRIGERG